ncbi:MAG: type II asparaginase [Desulfovibrio sp.]|jgi:L-asparaginase type II|nr:type II asparaginase [Desulfovibrio sp.]
MIKRLSVAILCLLFCGLVALPAVQAAEEKKPAKATQAQAEEKKPEKAAPAAQTEAKKLPKVTILGTGGTIAGSGGSATQLTGYKPGDLTADQLIAAVPGLKDFADISAEQVANIGSYDMTTEIWLKLAKRANELLSKDTDGIVITHGTDTQEETVYFLNLTVKSEKPVVTVGAMRPATAISADGPLNLLQAVAVAGSKEARGKGSLLVMNGEINGAREVTKTNTLQPETFRSNDLGFLGYVVNNAPVFYRTSLRKHTKDSEFDVSKLTALPKVEIVYTYVDSGLDALKGVIAGKAEGIVIAGMGNGSVSSEMLKVMKEAVAQGIVIVRSSRTGTGMITFDPKKGDDAGVVAADSLNPQKARILLMLALTKTKDPKDIRRIFATY